MAKQKDYIYAVGRRRTASARVRLHKGDKESVVNDTVIGQYFPGEQNRALWQRPFELTGTTGKYFITVKVDGGGKKGQRDAVIHGTARALSELSEEYRAVLKTAGLLTRDPRERERRKAGRKGRARFQPQSPKR
jgi:small subunit ribosomal protein S9